MKYTSLSLLVALQSAWATAFFVPSPTSSERDGFFPQQIPLQDQRIIDGGRYKTEGDRANAVKEAFSFAWEGYWSKCKGEDEISPVSNSCSNPRNHWGASAVDALSTAAIMDLQSIVGDILSYIPGIDFSTTSTDVSLFETTIRYLGGLLSAYDLLTGPFSHLAPDNTAVTTLLAQAIHLADSLAFAFDTPTGIPHNDINIVSRTPSSDSQTNGLATTGTLVLEWQRLSDITHDARYGALAQKAESYLLNPAPSWNVPFPGLLGTNINISSGLLTDATGGWNGGDDSFYEYLIKMFVYNPEKYPHYRDAWIKAADSTIEHLASHPVSQPHLTFLSSFVNNSRLVNVSQHLTCFAGGSFLLSGSALSRPDYTQFGLDLVDGCHVTYASTTTGIGPEVFSWDVSALDENSSEKAFFDKHGFYITNGVYDLRPEVIESYYYAYRYTGDKKYQDWAWDAFVAINASCRAGHGFSAISDVNDADGGGFLDDQESFLFAEVLKYAYLIQAPDLPVHAGPRRHDDTAEAVGTEEWVFNTEAHPFKVVR